MSDKRKRPNKVWMAGFNLRGLWSARPILGTKDEEDHEWWSEDGDLSVTALGLRRLGGDRRCVEFASTDKKEVQTWIDGARAVLDSFRDLCTVWNGK